MTKYHGHRTHRHAHGNGRLLPVLLMALIGLVTLACSDSQGQKSEVLQDLSREGSRLKRQISTLTEEAKTLPEYTNIVQSERGNLAGIMTTTLWKRLESSIPAFRSTLLVLMESNRRFRDQILSGNVSQDEGVHDSEEELTIAMSQDEELDSDDLDQGEDYIAVQDRSYPAEHFDCPRWLSDLESDAQTLGKILEALECIGPEDDAKLHEIKSFIRAPGVAGEKLLVFTGSKVTASYLHQQLRSDNPNIQIDLVIGGDSRTSDKIAKFSPKSNGDPDLPDSEQTTILIATDVLAKGQNLQDCNRVFSYDLHWNPVTLIQRLGRVDRLTTEHSDVYLLNMMPAPAVEKEIGVRGTVAERVQASTTSLAWTTPYSKPVNA